METHESCRLNLEIASEEACRLFVEIFEKLETRKVDPGIDFNSLVEVFRATNSGCMSTRVTAAPPAWFPN